MQDAISKLLKYAREEMGYPETHVLQGGTGTEVQVDGRTIQMFGSYNYLGLAGRQEVKEAMKAAIDKYGAGSGGVRLLTGTMDIHQELERRVAAVTGHEDCLTVASGFGMNSGVIPAVVNLLGFADYFGAKKAVIFSDEYNHASIVDGCRLAKATVEVYQHNDLEKLDKLLKKYPSKKYRKLVIFDGVFSMDGDFAPVDKLVDLAKKHEAWTMVDDAHAFGAFGKDGAGSADHLGRRGMVDINMGTFSKGIGVAGGFVSGSKELIDYLRIGCRSYVFSDSLLPAIAAGIITTLDIIKAEPQLQTQVQENAEYFRQRLHEHGFDTLRSTTQVVPVLIGDEHKTMDLAHKLFEAGYYAPAVRWPAVPKGMARIRFSMMSNHTRGKIDELVSEIKKLA
jgi:8-amino-7-oxononanoate synthase